MADRQAIHLRWVFGCVAVAFGLAASTGFAQEPVTATIEPVQESNVTAAPQPLSSITLHTAPRTEGKIPGAVSRPSQNLFPVTPFVANACGWPCDCPYGRYYLLCHDPLLMEDVALERYGCEQSCYAQPVTSAVKFFATVPLVPVKAAMHCCYPCGWSRDYMCQLRPGYCEGGCKPWCCTTPYACCEP